MARITQNTKKIKLSTEQEKALNFLVFEDYTQKATAEAIGVSLSTVNGWVNKDLIFQKEYKKAIDKMANISMGKFKAKVNKAIETLFELMDNSKNEMVRFNAAKEIIARAENGSTLSDKLMIEKIKRVKAETKLMKSDGEINNQTSKLDAYEQRKRGREAVNLDTS